MLREACKRNELNEEKRVAEEWDGLEEEKKASMAPPV